MLSKILVPFIVIGLVFCFTACKSEGDKSAADYCKDWCDKAYDECGEEYADENDIDEDDLEDLLDECKDDCEPDEDQGSPTSPYGTNYDGVQDGGPSTGLGTNWPGTDALGTTRSDYDLGPYEWVAAPSGTEINSSKPSDVPISMSCPSLFKRSSGCPPAGSSSWFTITWFF